MIVPKSKNVIPKSSSEAANTRPVTFNHIQRGVVDLASLGLANNHLRVLRPLFDKSQTVDKRVLERIYDGIMMLHAEGNRSATSAQSVVSSMMCVWTTWTDGKQHVGGRLLEMKDADQFKAFRKSNKLKQSWIMAAVHAESKGFVHAQQVAAAKQRPVPLKKSEAAKAFAKNAQNRGARKESQEFEEAMRFLSKREIRADAQKAQELKRAHKQRFNTTKKSERQERIAPDLDFGGSPKAPPTEPARVRRQIPTPTGLEFLPEMLFSVRPARKFSFFFLELLHRLKQATGIDIEIDESLPTWEVIEHIRDATGMEFDRRRDDERYLAWLRSTARSDEEYADAIFDHALRIRHVAETTRRLRRAMGSHGEQTEGDDVEPFVPDDQSVTEILAQPWFATLPPRTQWGLEDAISMHENWIVRRHEFRHHPSLVAHADQNIANLREVIVALLLMAGVEPNPGPSPLTPGPFQLLDLCAYEYMPEERAREFERWLYSRDREQLKQDLANPLVAAATKRRLLLLSGIEPNPGPKRARERTSTRTFIANAPDAATIRMLLLRAGIEPNPGPGPKHQKPKGTRKPLEACVCGKAYKNGVRHCHKCHEDGHNMCKTCGTCALASHKCKVARDKCPGCGVTFTKGSPHCRTCHAEGHRACLKCGGCKTPDHACSAAATQGVSAAAAIAAADPAAHAAQADADAEIAAEFAGDHHGQDPGVAEAAPAAPAEGAEGPAPPLLPLPPPKPVPEDEEEQRSAMLEWERSAWETISIAHRAGLAEIFSHCIYGALIDPATGKFLAAQMKPRSMHCIWDERGWLDWTREDKDWVSIVKSYTSPGTHRIHEQHTTLRPLSIFAGIALAMTSIKWFQPGEISGLVNAMAAMLPDNLFRADFQPAPSLQAIKTLAGLLSAQRHRSTMLKMAATLAAATSLRAFWVWSGQNVYDRLTRSIVPMKHQGPHNVLTLDIEPIDVPIDYNDVRRPSDRHVTINAAPAPALFTFKHTVRLPRKRTFWASIMNWAFPLPAQLSVHVETHVADARLFLDSLVRVDPGSNVESTVSQSLLRLRQLAPCYNTPESDFLPVALHRNACTAILGDSIRVHRMEQGFRSPAQVPGLGSMATVPVRSH